VLPQLIKFTASSGMVMTFSSDSWTWQISETFVLKIILLSHEAEQKNQQDGANHSIHIAIILG